MVFANVEEVMHYLFSLKAAIIHAERVIQQQPTAQMLFSRHS